MTCGTKDGKIHLYTPLKAIRRKCLDCCCGSSKEVELCPVQTCSLYPYRFGQRPTTRKNRAQNPPDLVKNPQIAPAFLEESGKAGVGVGVG